MAMKPMKVADTSVGAKLDTVNANLDSLEAMLDGLEGYTDGIETKLDTINMTLTTLNGYVDGLEGFVDGLEGSIGAAGDAAGANTLMGQLKSIASEDFATETTLAVMATNIADIETLLTTQNGYLDGVEGKLDTIGGYLDGVEGKLDTIANNTGGAGTAYSYYDDNGDAVIAAAGNYTVVKAPNVSLTARLRKVVISTEVEATFTIRKREQGADGGFGTGGDDAVTTFAKIRLQAGQTYTWEGNGAQKIVQTDLNTAPAYARFEVYVENEDAMNSGKVAVELQYDEAAS